MVPAGLRGAPSAAYFHSFLSDTFFSESFFMTLATAISKSSCARMSAVSGSRPHSRTQQSLVHAAAAT